MLVPSKGLMQDAREGGYAVGAFNALDYPTVDAIITAAEEMGTPVLVQIGDLLNPNAIESRKMTPAEAKNFMRATVARAEFSPVPVAIHLDHCRTYEGCMRAIQAGATSVMIDASMLPFEENIALTNKVLEAARTCNVTVEAEIGHVAFPDDPVGEIYTTVTEARKFYEETDVDLLAVAIGTAHGVYATRPTLQTDRIAELKESIPVPLVMHGASGLTRDEYRTCIKNGITKINFATYMSIAGATAMKNAALEVEEDNKLRFDVLLKAGFKGMKEIVKQHIEIFGTARVI